MAGYPATPLVTKLGVKEGHRVLLRGAPTAWSIDDLPSNVLITRRRSGAPSDLVVAFFRDVASLQHDIDALSRAIAEDGALWIAWPRKAAGHVSDITDNLVRDAVLPHGLVDVKVAALDDDWSALKFVWRKTMRSHA